MTSTFLVTGASRGIGRAAAARLLDTGARVIGIHRRASSEVASWAEPFGDRLVLVRTDLTSPDVLEPLSARVSSLAPALAGVVLNAGIAVTAAIDAPAVPGELDPLQSLVSHNLLAPLVLLRALLRRSLLGPGSSVVVVSSNLARRGLPGKAGYAASKGGLESAVRSLAHELGPRGIRINAVAPGLLRTDMTAHVSAADLAAHARTVPLGRIGVPEDVAPAIAFLLGRDADYVTGQLLDVDGGWSA